MFFIKAYRGVVVGVALMFVVLFVRHSFLSSPGMVSDQKYPKENYVLEHALAFIEREINKHLIVWAISRQCFVFMVITSTMITLAAIIGDGSLFHHQLLQVATWLVPWCTHEICNVYNKRMHLQPPS